MGTAIAALFDTLASQATLRMFTPGGPDGMRTPTTSRLRPLLRQRVYRPQRHRLAPGLLDHLRHWWGQHQGR